ncbi:hypothetical protein ACFQ60_29890 [Streptomyces zhihengii]
MALWLWLLFDVMIGAVNGHAGALIGIGALTIFCVSLAANAFTRLFGLAAIIPVMVVLMLLGVPASGGGLPLAMVPDIFRTLHDVLPLPAAVGTARDLVYFGGDAIGGHLLTIGVWGAAGLLLNLFADRWIALRAAKGKGVPAIVPRATPGPRKPTEPAPRSPPWRARAGTDPARPGTHRRAARGCPRPGPPAPGTRGPDRSRPRVARAWDRRNAARGARAWRVPDGADRHGHPGTHRRAARGRPHPGPPAPGTLSAGGPGPSRPRVPWAFAAPRPRPRPRPYRPEPCRGRGRRRARG